MTNSKTTKGALLASGISLLLCCAMLLGTTFAWFTDSVTSANNIIKSGNLDVTFEYWNGTEWTDVSGKSDILTNTLWEPGVTEIAYLRVANAGSLALKYQLGVNIVSEKPGVNVAGEPFKLSDSIMFGVVENVEENAYSKDDAGRAAAIAAVTDAKKISAGYTKDSTILAGDKEQNFALVVYMPTTVGNEANHNGENIPQIDLGINVFATQLANESDSFDNQYDADADLINVTVSNEAELVAALAEAKNGDVIGISGNVTWTTGGAHGSTPFVTDATYITLKGIGDSATFTAIGSGVGPVGIDNGTVIFKNLKIVDESASYAENAWEFGYLEFRGKTVFENCNVVNAIMMEGDSAKFTNCSFNSNKDNEYAVWVSEGQASFENCTFTGARGLKVHEAYGSEVDSVSVNNSKFVSLTKKPGVAIGDVNADTAISMTNNMFAGTQAGDQGNYKYESDTDVTTFDFVDKDNTVTGAATNSEELKNALTNDADTIYVSAGTYTFPASSLSEGDVIICDEDTVFEGVSKLNIKGATVVGATFKNPTGTAADQTINGTFKNCTFTGQNGLRWCYAGETVVFENCVFDGSVYGVHFDGGANYVTFKNCTISGFNAMGGAITKTTFDGCTFVANGKSDYNGINMWGDTDMKNCTFIFDGSCSYEWIDLCGADKTAIFTDCVVNDGTNTSNVSTLIGDKLTKRETSGKIIVDGKELLY